MCEGNLGNGGSGDYLSETESGKKEGERQRKKGVSLEDT